MATLRIVLDQRRPNKSGTFPLLFRVTVGNERRDISSGIKLQPGQFNDKKEQIVGDSDLNVTIQSRKIEYQKMLNNMLAKGEKGYSLEEIKDLLVGKPQEHVTVLTFWTTQIAKMQESGATGNARIHQTALNVISKHQNLNITFEEITYKDVVELAEALYGRGMTTNGVSAYIRAFRAIYNKALNPDDSDYKYYPFRKYKPKKGATVPRVLSLDELKSYFGLRLDKSSTYYYSWLIGMLIFMMRGINLRDLLLLTSKNIKSGRVIYRRAKTKKLYSVQILKKIEECMYHFEPNSVSLLGSFTEHDIKDKVAFEEIYAQMRKVINTHLKKLGKILKTDEPITTYVFRYSFSNIAKQLGYSKDLISESLGHDYGNATTSIYLEQFDQEELDALTEAVVKAVTE